MECYEAGKKLIRKTSERKYDETGVFIFNSKDEDFIHGNIKLNPALICKIEKRCPIYRMERFCKYCDVQKALPRLSPAKLSDIYKSKVSGCFNMFNLLKQRSKDNDEKTFKKVFKTTRDRIHSATKKPKYSEKFDLSYCSPWLSKAEPLSVTNSKAYPEKSNIYTNITATHHVDDDFVVVQESGEERFGFSNSAILVRATVAFPPICQSEIWTVGWIQGVTKDFTTYVYDKNEKLVI